MNCIMFDGVGIMGRWLYMANPRIYRMLGHIRAMHVVVVMVVVVVGGGGDEQCSNHSGMLASWGRECWFPPFTRVQHDVFMDWSV